MPVPYTPQDHRDRALELADRVYRATSDYQALAQVAVVHALLATAPPPKGTERLSTAASSLLLLTLVALICGTIVGVVWMVTR